MVEGARLESAYMGNCIAGSNPALSADFRQIRMKARQLGGLFYALGESKRGSVRQGRKKERSAQPTGVHSQ